MSVRDHLIKPSVNKMWRTIDYSFRWALGAFIIARIVFGLWSLAILYASPIVVQNLTLFGYSIVSAFDMRNSGTFFYLRDMQGTMLQFFPAPDHTLVDKQTGSHWDLVSGQALSGPLMGKVLQKAPIMPEQVFPYQGVKPYSWASLALWQRFDANWFLKIAERGYSLEDGSTAFFPLYPLLTRLVGILISNIFLASLIVSAISLVVALVLFQRVASDYGADVGSVKRALIYLLVFPSAFFLFAGYTEATYLAFVLGSFWFAKRRNWPMVAFMGAMAALTRGIGILLLLPLLYMWWTQEGQRLWRDALILQAIPLAALSYLVYTKLATFFSYQGQWHTEFSFPWQHFTEFVTLGLRHQLLPIDVFNLLITLLWGVLILFVWRKFPKELGLYSVLMLLTPLFGLNTGQPFVSMLRYVLVIFPVFILLGQWGKSAWINRLILYLSFPMALYFSAQFWMWGWVG